MATDVEICNIALTRIGHEVITSISPTGNKASRLCSLHYEITKKALLREHPWKFAIKRAELTVDGTEPAFEYAYRFPVPADCLRIIRINSDEYDDYRVESGFILTNEGTVNLEYILDVTDDEDFDSQFVDVFAQRLAAEIAYPLTENNTTTEQAWNVYNAKIRMARTMDAREGKPRGIDADTWLNVRV